MTITTGLNEALKFILRLYNKGNLHLFTVSAKSSKNCSIAFAYQKKQNDEKLTFLFFVDNIRKSFKGTVIVPV